MSIITVKEAARMTGVSPRGLRAACARGYIPGAVRIGRDWVIPIDGLTQYAANRPKRGRKPQK